MVNPINKIRSLIQPALEFIEKRPYLFILYQSFVNFKTNQIPVRAAALTFTTLLAIIPFGILLTSFAESLGYLDLLLEFLPTLEKNFELNLDMERINPIIDHIKSIRFGRLGVIGSLTLFVSFLLAMSNLEKAMNIIWSIKKNRNWLKRLRIYFPSLIFLLCFILLFVWILIRFRGQLDNILLEMTGSDIVKTLPAWIMLLSCVPLIFLFLWVLYKFIPNTKVKWKSAFVGTVICTVYLSILFYIALSVQTYFFTRYSVIYGSLSIFPIFMLFLYFNWIVVLYGVGLSHSHQKHRLLNPK